MIASRNGHVEVVNVLLQHEASVQLQNKVKTIFHLLDATVTCMGTPSKCCTDYYKKGILLHSLMALLILSFHKSHQPYYTDRKLDVSTAQVVQKPNRLLNTT